MYLQISRISQFRGRLSAADQFFFFVLIFMFLQNSRIGRFRVALRAAEWFFISVHVFDVFLDQQDSHFLFFYKCDYQKLNSQYQEFLVIPFLGFVFLTNQMSRFQESNSHLRNSQFLNFSYLEILEFAMNVGISQNRFSANQIPSFVFPSFVTPRMTFPVLSFSISCVNPSSRRAAYSRSHLETRVERMKTKRFLVEQQLSQPKRF